MEGLPAETVTTKVRGFGFYQAVPIYMVPRGLGRKRCSQATRQRSWVAR